MGASAVFCKALGRLVVAEITRLWAFLVCRLSALAHRHVTVWPPVLSTYSSQHCEVVTVFEVVMDDLSKPPAVQQREPSMTQRQEPEPSVMSKSGVYRIRRDSKILPWVATDLVAYGPFSKLPRQVESLQNAQVLPPAAPGPELQVQGLEHTKRQIDSFLLGIKRP